MTVPDSAVSKLPPPVTRTVWPLPVRKSLETSRKENAVAFAADLGVVDLRRCRIGDKTETMSGTPGRGCRDGDGDRPDLEEVPGKMVRRVVYAHEALCDVSPLDFNRINPPTHVSKRTVRDRKSTRLNSSHGYISYAVFCLKKKKRRYRRQIGEYLPYHTLQLVPS